MARPRIALVHATPVAVAPIAAAFASGWPQATITHLLDDSLSADLAAAGRLDDAMIDRFVTLARYVVGTGADAILFTCSAFGIAIEAASASVSVPVLKPNQAMFEAALAAGRRVALISTFEPSIPSMTRELEAMAAARGQVISLRTGVVPSALAHLQAGDGTAHDRLIAQAAAGYTDVDALMLAQFSMASAQSGIAPVAGRQVLTSPDSAVASLKRTLANGA